MLSEAASALTGWLASACCVLSALKISSCWGGNRVQILLIKKKYIRTNQVVLVCVKNWHRLLWKKNNWKTWFAIAHSLTVCWNQTQIFFQHTVISMAAVVSQIYKGGKKIQISSVLINFGIPQLFEIICKAGWQIISYVQFIPKKNCCFYACYC